MKIIALLINVSAHDWIAESAIIASNVLGTFWPNNRLAPPFGVSAPPGKS